MQKAYKFRLYPSQRQKQRLFNTFKVCKQIYNELLEMSMSTYKSEGKTLHKFDYNKYLTGKYPAIHSQVKQNVSDRAHKAFQNFFRRAQDKSCKRKGFPRFKSKVKSIIYPQSGFKFISDKRLYVSKIGNIPIVLHRTPRGKLKTMTIKVNRAGQWFAIFSCEVDIPKAEHLSDKQIGIDVGLENYVTLSNGKTIDNPKYIIKAEKRLKQLHRKLSRKKKKSANRKKACFRLAKQYIKVANQRKDFIHKLSRRITESYSFIAVENLNIKRMLHNHHLAKHIADVSWDDFIRCLEYKAVTSGSKLVKVNPCGTSKTCSNCGNIVDMLLHKRQFSCPSCGLVCHRDHNAAINILQVGRDSPEFTPVNDCVRPSIFCGLRSMKQELHETNS